MPKPYYKVKQINGKRFYVHRLIAGAKPGEVVDHINGDITDNRPENLRICTQGQNQKNMRMHKDNTSGYKGVSWQRGAWVCRVNKDGKAHYLGRYPDITEAAKAYNSKAIELFGEFANLNKV
jgi:HNH endonuclease